MEISQKLQPYIDTLELEKPIEYVRHNSLIAARTNPEDGEHNVFYHGDVETADLIAFNPQRPYLASFVHELCHLHLAEKIDPSFAGFTYEGPEDKVRLLSMIENPLADIWVNDVFYHHFPELFAAHHDGYGRRAAQFITAKVWPAVLPPTAPYTLAQNEAEARRHDLEHIDFRNLLRRAGFASKLVRSSVGQSLVGAVDPALLTQFQFKTVDQLWDRLRMLNGEVLPNTMEDIGTLADFLVSVPVMSYDRQEALDMHQEMINQFIAVGRLALSARLVDEHPRPVWHLE